MVEEAEIRRVPLRFFLGEFKIGEAARHLAVAPFSFTRSPLSLNDWPGANPPAGSDGYYHPSAPADPSLPVVDRRDGYLRYVPVRFPRHYIDMSGTMDDYAATFSGKTRSTLRRKVRKFAELDGDRLDWRAYATPAEMAEFYDLAREISAKTYQERLLDAGLPEGEAFRADMMRRAEAGLVRAYLLFLQGRPVSYLYLPIEGDSLIYAYLGYDPEHARHSPGTVLQWLAVEALFTEGGFRYFDFTEGQGAHKELFGTNSIFCANVFYLIDNARNRRLVRLHRSLSTMSDKMVAWLDRLGVKQALKKWLRARA